MKALYLRDKYLDSYMGEKDGRPCYTGPGRAKVWINGEIFNLAWVWPHGIVFLYRHFTKWIASLGLRSRFQLLPRNYQDFSSYPGIIRISFQESSEPLLAMLINIISEHRVLTWLQWWWLEVGAQIPRSSQRTTAASSLIQEWCQSGIWEGFLSLAMR